MTKKALFFNSLSFRFPSEPVKCYFSTEDDDSKKSDMLKSRILFPKELKALPQFCGIGGLDSLYTTYDKHCEGFLAVGIDFNAIENENFVKRYYSWKLKRLLSKHEELMFTQSGITHDLQVWAYNGQYQYVEYFGCQAKLFNLERYTLKVRFDALNGHPYLLVSNDRPATMLDVPLDKLDGDSAPLDAEQKAIPVSMVNNVMTRKMSGERYFDRRIANLKKLQERNIAYDASLALPILTREMKHLLGLDSQARKRDWSSKYVKYLERITWFKDKYLVSSDIRKVFTDISSEFTTVNIQQLGQVDKSMRILRFGSSTKSPRPQEGINAGPAKNCPNVSIQLIAIYHSKDKDYASRLLGYFRNGNYQEQDEAKRKRLQRYIGTMVNYAPKELHISFEDATNPLPEIRAALQKEAYNNLDYNTQYVGIYLSPIHKSSSVSLSRECYYQVKELFMRRGILTQCIDALNMINAINHDKETRKKNFIYTLQNMGVAICAKTGGSPWLLDEVTRKELIIGIGAFRTASEKYIGAAFSFDNTGILCNYTYFQPSEFIVLMGAIKDAIIRFSSVNNPPERLIIHYYKKLSMKHEAQQILDMLSTLGLDIPVYVVSINKTESEDLVVFDPQSTYSDKDGTHLSLMPVSGTWVNLGRVSEGYRFLLCNNTRYEDDKFRVTDGFPFPVKLTICCFGGTADIDTATIELLISQVYQFSRIYWRSVRQQGLPVTIKYPEMIAEIMPHFNSPSVYPGKGSLWFL